MNEGCFKFFELIVFQGLMINLKFLVVVILGNIEVS